MRPHRDVRAELEAELRWELDESAWQYLVEKQHVQEVLDDLATVSELADTTRELRDAFGGNRPRPPAPRGRVSEGVAEPTTQALGAASTLYQEALSEAVAAVASEDRDVAAFRRTVGLQDELLSWQDVPTWIEARAAEQGRSSLWVTVIVDELPPSHEVAGPAASTSAHLLKYFGPEDTWTRQVATRAGHPLERLRVLAEALAAAHGWTDAQATVFVLTGLTPTVALMRTTTGGMNIRHGTWCAWSERIKLDIHPALTPDEVATHYRSARSVYEHSRTQGERAVRSQSPKHLRLARFRSLQPAGRAWRDQLAEWNSVSPAVEQYSHESNFRRDAALAVARLLYRGLYSGNAPLTGRRGQSSEGQITGRP